MGLERCSQKSDRYTCGDDAERIDHHTGNLDDRWQFHSCLIWRAIVIVLRQNAHGEEGDDEQQNAQTDEWQEISTDRI